MRLLEAARDLGASRPRTFLRVTLPLSWPSILAGTVLIVLPMFGDYYTNDLISGSPHTNMLGNSVNLLVQGGSQKNLGAALVLVLMTILAIGMLYYLWETSRQREEAGMSATTADPPAARRPRRARRRCVRAGCRTGSPTPGAGRASSPHHLALHRLGAAAGAGGDPLLLQRRPLAQRLAGLLDPLVVGRRNALGLPRPGLHQRPRPQPRAGGARHGDRDAARLPAGDRARAAGAGAARAAPTSSCWCR